ncbi:MAG: tyrosine-type recombinase/integrase, partial [Planctomycetota bacterium]
MMSTMIMALDEYLSLRRRLGFKLEDEGRILPKFVSFLEAHGKSHITTDLAVRWAANPPIKGCPAHVRRRLSMVRLFAEYLSATDPRNEVPSKTLLPGRYHRKPPFLYTDEQIVHLMEAARQLPSRCRSAQDLRARTYSTLLGLLSVTGMRISEIIALDRDDVDFVQGVLTIRGAKFGKSRLVPLHPTAQRALRQYADRRDRIYPRPQTQAFFVSARGVR